MKGPSQRAQAVLAHYKAGQALPAATKALVLDVVRERALRGDLPRFDVQAPAPVVPESGPLSALWNSPLTKLGLGLLVAGPVALGVIALRKEAPAPPPAQQHSAMASAVPTAEALPEPALPASAVSLPAGSTAPPTTFEKQASAASASGREGTIDEEVRLLNDAQAALRAGDPKRALTHTDEHMRRFPSGKLASARAVTRMMALCQAGRQDQARLEADRFLALYPGSPFADRVRGICSPRSP
jgi:hypothetical protein